VPNPPLARPNLQEARNRNHRARHLLTSVSRGTPALAEVWQQIELSLSDVPALASETAHLRSDIRAVRLGRANLAAAAQATLAASRDGEPDPLSYLRDELAAQGFLPEPDAATDDLMRRCHRGRR
jgi:hypothetical protein